MKLLDDIYNKVGQDLFGTTRYKQTAICEAIADELGIGTSAFYRWKSGRVQVPPGQVDKLVNLWQQLNKGEMK